MTERGYGGWRGAGIALRLLAFNLLVVFVPIVGVLSLDVYERQLLDAQERAMVQQARVLAAALGGTGSVDTAVAHNVINRVGGRTDARLRVFDRQGLAVADSAEVRSEAAVATQASRYAPTPDVRGSVLYRVGVVLQNTRTLLSSSFRSKSGTAAPASTDRHPANAVDTEVASALAGRYGATVRATTGQRSLTLYSAVPIRDADRVVGAVVVSQSTFRTLQALYSVRLRIFRIVVASVLLAALLTTVAATTIVRPLTRLARATASLAERRSPLLTALPGVRRGDEIGDVARAFQDLTRRLNTHITVLEGFAADVAHEFKNPLGGIRVAAETIEASADAGERNRFAGLIVRDVTRLERLVSSLRDLARVDQRLEDRGDRRINLTEMVRSVADRTQALGNQGVRVEVDSLDRCFVGGDPESLDQAFENVLANAVSFAPAGTVVDVRISGAGDACCVTVGDRGPGLPEAHLKRVFDRFFSYRPNDGPRDHLGLGLAIAKRVVEGHGGTITAANRQDGGARFELRLPMARAAESEPRDREVADA